MKLRIEAPTGTQPNQKGEVEPLPESIIVRLKDRARIRKCIEMMHEAKFVAVDTETTGRDRMNDSILYWSFSTGYNRFTLPNSVLPMFKPTLEDRDIHWVMHNADFDLSMFSNHGISMNDNIWDTMVMHWLNRQADNVRHGLKGIAQGDYNITMEAFEDVFPDKTMLGYSIEEVDDYASKDAYATLFAFRDMRRSMRKEPSYGFWEPRGGSMLDLYWEVDRGAMLAMWRMSRRGVLVSPKFLGKISREAESDLDGLERELTQLYGDVFNPDSPKQVSDLLFRQLGLPVLTVSQKTGDPSTAKDVIDHLVDEALPEFLHEFEKRHAGDEENIQKMQKGAAVARRACEAIRTHRSLGKTLGTFIGYLETSERYARKKRSKLRKKTRAPDERVKNGLLGFMDDENRIHTSYNLLIDTSRTSSRDPNLQNIPADKKKDIFQIRKAFIAPPGHKLVVADYCLAAGTQVQTPGGTKAIEDIRVGDLVYSFNKETQKPRCSRVTNTWDNGRKETLVVILDNGKRVRCTPNHEWYLHDGQKARADKLEVGSRLLPLRRSYAGASYLTLYSHSSHRYAYEHQVVAEAAYGPRPEGHHTHHRDENKKNNTPENLEYLPEREHRSEHSREILKREWRDPEKRISRTANISRALRETGACAGEKNGNYGNLKGTLSSCQGCGDSFYRSPSHDGKYCSQTCYDLNRRKGLQKNCARCGEEFYVKPSKSHQVFCSRSCSSLSQNHEVVEIIWDQEVADTYDIEVEGDHNFALEAGVFVSNSQGELRLMGVASGDPGLMAAINDGRDIHCYCATIMFPHIDYEEILAAKSWDKSEQGPPPKEVVDLQWYRYAIKTISFLLIYGGSKYLLCENLNAMGNVHYTVDEAEGLQEKYFKSFPGVRAYMSDVLEFGKKKNFVSTILGHRRYLGPQLHARDKQTRERAERQAGNTPVQGALCDVLKMAMIRVEEDKELWRWGARMVLQVHDELVLEVPAKFAKQTAKRVVYHMDHPGFDVGVPLGAEAGIGDNWLEAK